MVVVLQEDVFVGLTGALPFAHALEDATQLEPDVPLLQRGRGLGEDVPEALEGLRPLALVLVDDAESEVDLVGLFEVWVEFEDFCERFFSVVEGAVSVVEDTNSVPQLRHVRVAQVVQGLLVGVVGPLQVVEHQVAVAERGPHVAQLGVDLQRALVQLRGLLEHVPGPVQVCQRGESLRRGRIGLQSRIVGHGSPVCVAERLSERGYRQPSLSSRLCERIQLLFVCGISSCSCSCSSISISTSIASCSSCCCSCYCTRSGSHNGGISVSGTVLHYS